MGSEGLQAEWRRRGTESTVPSAALDGTIVPTTEPLLDAHAALATVLERLPEVRAQGEPLVTLASEIARGGMGVVYVGEQRSLGREVAVKAARARADSDGDGDVGDGGDDERSDTLALLREAWISGHLEHPNVIPIYALYREGRTPLLLMKRVEGASWSDRLRAGGALQDHLRTLVQLCHAAHFAHSRGIVHLDLKPANVMIGEFGEIYLLDWGIAASIVDSHPPFIVRAATLRCVLGTPAYMAPELALGDGANIGPRTDVYLLGALLHELLVGAPPHAADTVMASLVSAFESRPLRWPDGVPEELGAIASKAMARDPAQRYGSAAALREALESYLVHADSLALAAAARERAAAAMVLLEAEDAQEHAAAPDGASSASSDEIDRLAGEAEFGFRQALEVWQDNGRAREGLQLLLERLITRDLARGRWPVAARRAATLPEPRPRLAERIDELQRADASKARELERRREDVDLGRAARQRSTMAFVGAFGWFVLLVGLALLGRSGVLRVSHPHMLGVTSSAALIFSMLVLRGRGALLANAINRSVVALLALGWVFGSLYWVGAWIVGAPFGAAVIGIGPLIALVVAAAAATVDRRLVPHAIVAAIAAALQPLFADYALEVLGATGALVLAMIGLTWRTAPARDGDGAAV